jgi:hypothetical protein
MLEGGVMRYLSLHVLLASSLVACGTAPAPEGPKTASATLAAPAAPAARARNAPAGDIAVPGGLPMDQEYRRAIREWGQAYYAHRSEEEVYASVKREDMHFLYVAFLELFPGSLHRAEIQGLMQHFALYDATGRTTLSIGDLKSKYGYDGDNGVYAWNNAFNPSVVTDRSARIWPAPLCYGSLQFLTGGFVHRKTALELIPGTTFIYRSRA